MAFKPNQTPKITEPAVTQSARLVQNVYEGSDGIDYESRDGFSEYLVERMYGRDDEVSRTYVPGEEVVVERAFREWIITPRTALVASIASFVLFSIVGNAKSIVAAGKNTVRDIAHEIDPKTRTLPPSTISQPPRTETFEYGVDNQGKQQKVGQAEKDNKKAKEIAKKLKATLKNGKIVSITITGQASDEWLGNGEKSIGRTDRENNELAKKRADIIAPELAGSLKDEKVDYPKIKTDAKEKVLDDEKLADLLLQVQKSKYGSILEAIQAVKNDPSSVPEDLRRSIYTNFNQSRKNIVEIKIVENQDVPGSIESVPGRTVEVPPEKDPTPWKLFPFLPIPPIFRRRTEAYNVFEKPPQIIEEPLDKVWVELYQEALKPGNKLVDDAWAYSRKYQYLYREERVTQAIRYDYVDDAGKDRSIDVLFVDRPELDQATIEAIHKLMFDISLMQEGKIAENLDTVVIHPTENTGPQRPDKIGLGIDEQLHTNIAGIAIPVLGLVELHIPKNPSKQDIERFCGLRWVFAHEVAGHFTDVNTAAARGLIPVSSNRPGKTYETYNPWKGAGDDSYRTLAFGVQVSQFAIPHPEGVNQEHIVNVGDSALTQAPSARLRNEPPTQYAGTQPEEVHAEVAAAVTTDILIPAKEAGIDAKVLGDKKGYKVDAGLQHRFVRHVGAATNTNVDGLEWPAERVTARQETFSPTVLVGRVEINSDQDQNSTSETAKNQPYQPDEQRLKILAPVRR